MRPPRSLKITDHVIGTGRQCEPGDIAVLHCVCTRRKGDIVFASDPASPFSIRVGARDGYVGIEYGLLGMRINGRQSIIVPENLTYHERKTYQKLPADTMLVYDLQLIDLPSKWDADMERRLADGRESATPR